jgi:hypothetical protein
VRDSRAAALCECVASTHDSKVSAINCTEGHTSHSFHLLHIAHLSLVDRSDFEASEADRRSVIWPISSTELDLLAAASSEIGFVWLVSGDPSAPLRARSPSPFFFLLSAESAAGMRLPGSDNPDLDLNIHFSRVVSAEHTFITFFSVNIHAW